MKCRYVGFRVERGPKVDPKKLETAILTQHGEKCKFRGRTRIFSVVKTGDYLAGRWMLLKGSASFIQYDTGVDAASISSLPPGCELAACNYFAINLVSWHGLYQQHRASSGMRDFCDYLISRASPDLKKDTAKAVKDAGGRKNISSDKLKKIQEDHLLTWHVLFTKEKLERLLKELDKMTEVFYTIATIKPSEAEYGPLAHDLKAEVHRLKLTTSVEARQPEHRGLVERVMKFFDWLGKKKTGVVERSGVVGFQNKNQRTIRIGDIVERFGEDEVDDVLTAAELAGTDLRKSALVTRLIDIAEDNEVYFRKGAS